MAPLAPIFDHVVPDQTRSASLSLSFGQISPEMFSPSSSGDLLFTGTASRRRPYARRSRPYTGVSGRPAQFATPNLLCQPFSLSPSCPVSGEAVNGAVRDRDAVRRSPPPATAEHHSRPPPLDRSNLLSPSSRSCSAVRFPVEQNRLFCCRI